MGRLVRDPEVRYSQGHEPLAVARYTLAVDRKIRNGPILPVGYWAPLVSVHYCLRKRQNEAERRGSYE